MKCHNIKHEQQGKLITAGLPDGDNSRSVQVKVKEKLPVSIRSKGFSGDIFSAVSFIIHSKKTEDDIQKDLPKAKRWVCKTLSYHDFLNGNYTEATNQKINISPWLDELKQMKSIQNKLSNLENKPIGQDTMEKYIDLPHVKWIDEGLRIATFNEFDIRYDLQSNRIVFPIHNKDGEIIGVKARRINSEDDDRKYIYTIPCNKSIELYNLHRALPHILKSKEVIIFEGAKTTMIAWQFSKFNTVSIEGDELTDDQVKLVKGLGLDIKVVIMMDKDKTKKAIFKQAAKITNRDVYAMWDKHDLLGDPKLKHSPTDLGQEVFEKLYNSSIFKINK